MVQKRPFVEELSDVSSKHLRLEHGSQLVSFLEFPFQVVSQDPHTSGGEDLFIFEESKVGIFSFSHLIFFISYISV